MIHTDDVSGQIVVQEPWEVTDPGLSMVAQTDLVQPQSAPQQPPQTQPPPQQPRPAAQRTPSVPAGTGSRANGMISLNFDDADVYSVAQTIFGEILRVNYVIDQRVKGRVTFRSVAPVASDQVLPLMEVILRLNGIGVVEESNLYRIVPIGDVAKEPAHISIGREPDKIPLQGKSIIHVIPITYGSSTEMVKLVTPFLTTSAIVIDVPTMNHIVIVDTDANVRRILGLIKMFDSEETRAKKPQVYVYHIQNSKAKDVAAILQQAFSTTTIVMPSTTTTTTAGGSTPSPMQPQSQTPRLGTTPGGTQPTTTPGTAGSLVSPMTKIIADEGLNLLVVLALPEDYEIIKNAIQRVDIIPRQVIIEGVIAEVNLTDDLSLGISWALQFNPSVFKGFVGKTIGSMGFNVVDSSGTSLVKPQTGASDDYTSTNTFGSSGQFSVLATVNDNFTAAINTLASQSKAKLLAVPRILVSDNKEASIQVGEQVPITTSESYTTSTSTTYSTVQYKDIGIILKVKPRINEGGLVTLDLSQEISSYSIKDVTGSDKGVVVSKTEAKTSLVVQSGQTIVIGGLIREDVSDSRAGIPILSKIPILGYLFGNTDKTNHRKELIILLKPNVITNQAEAQAVTSSYVNTITETGKGKITKEELLRELDSEPPDKGTPDNSTKN